MRSAFIAFFRGGGKVGMGDVNRRRSGRLRVRAYGNPAHLGSCATLGVRGY